MPPSSASPDVVASQHRAEQYAPMQQDLPADRTLGTRPGYPECTSLRNITLILQVSALYLLRFPLRLGRLRRLCRQIPAIHLLSHHGHSAIQPLLAIMAPSPITTIHKSRSCSLDPPGGDQLHAVLLVSLRLLPTMAIYPHLDPAHRLRPGLACHYHAIACSDHAIALGYADS